MSIWIVFLPFIGFLIAGGFGRILGHRPSELITTALVLLAAVLAWIQFFTLGDGEVVKTALFNWISLPSLDISWSVRVDAMTKTMFVVVMTVSALVHLYSIGYMHEDESRARFFSYLSLFTFMMLMLVTADNFVQLFFGWEGVGLASYLLIGFWFHKKSACDASMKAFIVNRVGDCGLILALCLIYKTFGSFDFDTVFAALSGFSTHTTVFLGYTFHTVSLIVALLFVGAMGKSAQFLLHTWLPDAMEGPTPVSALIHAATMVTAGVFLVCRASFIFEMAPEVMAFITIIGAITAFFAATVGLVQNDIKRVIAYSTCSQLGYMFFVAGLGGYQIAMFHLFTHAFFKALLFLGAGSVIHALHHEQDIRQMGGIYRKVPQTFLMMVIGTIAITGLAIPGVFGFAGAYSKDAIIEFAFVSGHSFATFAFVVGILGAFMTAFYSWRLIFLVFTGQYRGDQKVLSHAHESPFVMLVPLYVLSFMAIIAGAVFYDHFLGHDMVSVWKNAMFTANESDFHKMHHVPLWVKLSPLLAALSGFVVAWIMYCKAVRLPNIIATDFAVFYKFFLNKWYFDEIYDFIFVRPFGFITKMLAQVIDRKVIDGIPNTFAYTVDAIGGKLSLLHNGRLYTYAFIMLMTVTLLLLIVL